MHRRCNCTLLKGVSPRSRPDATAITVRIDIPFKGIRWIEELQLKRKVRSAPHSTWVIHCWPYILLFHTLPSDDYLLSLYTYTSWWLTIILYVYLGNSLSARQDSNYELRDAYNTNLERNQSQQQAKRDHWSTCMGRGFPLQKWNRFVSLYWESLGRFL